MGLGGVGAGFGDYSGGGGSSTSEGGAALAGGVAKGLGGAGSGPKAGFAERRHEVGEGGRFGGCRCGGGRE